MRFALAILVLVSTKSSRVKYLQNCAARGPCKKKYGFRDKKINTAPEGSPKGHLLPVGHRDFEDSWDGAIDVLTSVPDPATFWKKYHKEGRSFLLKGGALASRAMNWTDDFIIQNFGKYSGKTEWKNEDRLTDYCGMQIKDETIFCPKDTIPYVETRLSIEQFIKNSRKKPKYDKYIITQAPDEMVRDFEVPSFHLCGKRGKHDLPDGQPWMTQMYENNFWYVQVPEDEIASSVMHFDMNHQIMCLFAGQKEWIMWDLNTEAKRIPMWNEFYRPRPGRAQGSDDSPIDPERVDLVKWPKFAKARWTNATMEAGDCIYTPAQLLHYVRTTSVGERRASFALMTMFQQEEKFDATHCTDTPEYVNLASFDTLWDFPGDPVLAPRCQNHVKMGYPNWKAHTLRPLAQLAEKQKLTEKTFVQILKRGAEPARYSEKRLRKVWNQWTEEVGGTPSPRDVYTSRVIRETARDVACANNGHNGPAKTTENGEYIHRSEYSLKGDKAGMVDEAHAEL